MYHDFRRGDSWGICKVYFEGKKKKNTTVSGIHIVRLLSYIHMESWAIMGESVNGVSWKVGCQLSAMDFAEAKGTNFVTQLMVFDESAASRLLIL